MVCLTPVLKANARVTAKNHGATFTANGGDGDIMCPWRLIPFGTRVKVGDAVSVRADRERAPPGHKGRWKSKYRGVAINAAMILAVYGDCSSTLCRAQAIHSSHVVLGLVPPHARRVLYATTSPCLLDADWC